MKNDKLRKNTPYIVIVIILGLLLFIIPPPFGNEIVRGIGIISSLLGLVYAIRAALDTQQEKKTPETAKNIVNASTPPSTNYSPKNPGTILENMLESNWNRNEIKTLEGYVSLGELKAALSYFAFRMLEKDYDRAELKTYNAFDRHVRPRSGYSDSGSSNLKLNIDSIPQDIDIYKLSKNKLLWVKRIGFGILKLPIWILLLPFDIIGSILLYRILYRIVPDNIYEIINKTLSQIRNFFDFNKKINRRKSRALLDVASKAGLINLTNDQFEFTHDYWKEYFAAVYLKTQNITENFRTVKYDSYWQRIDSDFDSAIIMLCGLVDNPNKILSVYASLDPILAAKCLVSINQEPSIQVKQAIIENLRKVLYDVRPGGEMRSMECVEAFSLFSPPPIELVSDILDILHKEGFSNLYGYRLKNIVATFGDKALPILLSRMKDNDHTLSFIIPCLGKIGNKQVIPVLKNYCDSSKAYIQERAYCALNHLGYEPAQMWLLNIEAREHEKFLDSVKGIFWNLADYGVSEIPFMIKILEAYRCAGDNAFTRVIEMNIGQPAVPVIVEYLTLYTGRVKAVLVDTLKELGDPKIIDPLTRIAQDKSIEVRIQVLKALTEIAPTDGKSIAVFYAALHDENTAVKAQGIRSLPTAQFSKTLIEILQDDRKEYSGNYYNWLGSDDGHAFSEIAAYKLSHIKSDEVKTTLLTWGEKRLYMDGKTGLGDRENVCDVAAEILENLKDTRADEILKKWREKELAVTLLSSTFK